MMITPWKIAVKFVIFQHFCGTPERSLRDNLHTTHFDGELPFSEFLLFASTRD